MAEYAAGRLPAERLASAVAAAYYEGDGRREMLRPVMAVIERAHPGIVELSESSEKPGFAVRLAERPFPKRYEAELREGVQAVLVGRFDVPEPPAPTPKPGLFARIVNAIRRVFRG